MSGEKSARSAAVAADEAVTAGTPGGTAAPAYSLRDVAVRLGEKEVLVGATADFAAGRVHVVRGVSGAGKTTLLRLLMGLVEPSVGEVVRPPRARLAASFQDDRLCGNLTVSANVRMPLGGMRGRELGEFLAREREALSAVGMAGLEGARVCELSGGQQRRVSLLRAALAPSDVLFLDEPLRGLDEGTQDAVAAWLTPLLAGKTVFWVTHSERDLARLTRPVLWTVDGGRVLPSHM